LGRPNGPVAVGQEDPLAQLLGEQELVEAPLSTPLKM
jgi:hypothetical protein